MSIRTRLLYAALAFLLLFLLAALMWPFLRIDERLRRQFLNQFSANFNGTVDLKKVEMGFLALNLRGLEISDSAATFSLRVTETQVHFNFWRFLTHHFSLVQGISKVNALGPEIFVRLPQTNMAKSSANPPLEKGWEVLNNLPDFIWIERVSVTAGIFHLLTSAGDPLWTMTNLNGEIHTIQPGVLKGRLGIGPVTNGEPSSEFRVLLDAEHQKLESVLKARLQNIVLGSEFGLPDSLTVRIDRLSADLRLWNQDEENGFDGNVQLGGSALEARGQEIIRCDTMNFIVGNWKVLLPKVKGKGLGGDWMFQGEIPDIKYPSWDLQITGASQDCRNVAQKFFPKLNIFPSGGYQLRTHITGTPDKPRISFEGKVDRITTSVDEFDAVSFFCEWEPHSFDLHRFSARHSTGMINYAGRIDFSPDSYRAELRGEGNLPRLAGMAPGTLNLQFSGKAGEHHLHGTWQNTAQQTYPVEIDASYFSSEQTIKASFHTADDRSSVDIELQDLSTIPRYHFTIDNLFLMTGQLYVGSEWDRLKGVYLTGELEGSLRDMNSRLEIFYAKVGSRFQFNGSINAGGNDGISYSGAMNFQQGSNAPLQGFVDLKWKQNALILNTFELDDAIFAQGSLDFQTHEIGLTELRVTNWDLAKGVQLFFPDIAPRIGGVLNGRVELLGSLNHPRMSLNFYASQGRFRDQNDFWAVVSADLADETLTVNECNIGRGLTSLISVNGAFAVDGSDIALYAASHRADVSDILNLIGANPLRIKGPLRLDAELNGSFLQPDLSITLKVMPGYIDKVPFQHLEAAVLLDSTTGRTLQLKDFHLVQAPDLAMVGSGTLPAQGTPLNLGFSLTGDILKIPHLIEKSIYESQGQGELRFAIEESRGAVRLTQAELTVHNGLMRFPDVISGIDDLEADLRLEGNRVRINQLQGSVNHQVFRFENYFSEATDSLHLKHLYFPSVDLDLGVITLTTEGRGLSIRIPSLMVKGSKGYFQFSGKKQNEKFSFSGPVNNLHIRGTLRMSHTIVTYPFPSSGKRPSKFIRGLLNVLTSSEWDLTVIPERDNRYVREIKGNVSSPLLEGMSDLLTTVDVNVNINPGLSNLQILGSLHDRSFRMLGKFVFTRGSIEYLDFKFRVDRFEVEFDEYNPLPWVEGRGETVYVDSLGISRNVYLTLYVVDPVTGERTRRGRWGDFIFILEDDAGSSQEQILAAMGYSPEKITEKMTTISGQIVSNAVLRRWIRPIERELEGLLNVDYIRLQPTIAQHLFETEILGIDPGLSRQVEWGAYYLRQSQLSIGKYFTDDVFITYTGMYESAINAQNERRFGLLHRWSLEYRLSPISKNLVLDFGYEYDSLEKLQDREVQLRYSVLF